MPIQASNTRILLNQYDLSSISNQLQIAIDSQSVTYNIFGDSAKHSIPGDPDVKITHSGYYTSPGLGKLEREMYEFLGAEATLGIVLGTDQAVPVGYVLPSTYAGQLTIDAPAANLITVKGLWPTKADQLYRGYEVFSGIISATGAQTKADFGAVPAAGGKAWLFCYANVGTMAGGVTVAVQSDDNSALTSPTTRGTFTATSVGVYEIDLAVVERYMRIFTTSMAGATSFTCTAIVTAAGLTM